MFHLQCDSKQCWTLSTVDGAPPTCGDLGSPATRFGSTVRRVGRCRPEPLGRYPVQKIWATNREPPLHPVHEIHLLTQGDLAPTLSQRGRYSQVQTFSRGSSFGSCASAGLLRHCPSTKSILAGSSRRLQALDAKASRYMHFRLPANSQGGQYKQDMEQLSETVQACRD